MPTGEKQMRGSGGSLEPPMHLHTVYMGFSGCLPTLLNPLAERILSLPGTNGLSYTPEEQASGMDLMKHGGSSQVRKTPSWPRSWANSSLP